MTEELVEDKNLFDFMTGTLELEVPTGTSLDKTETKKECRLILSRRSSNNVKVKVNIGLKHRMELSV